MSPESSSNLPPQPTTSSTSSSEKMCFNESNKKLQIFLGGSCNPTTWRQNVAIPYLEMNGISYYNPQVDNWTPEVVKTERYAKQNAQVLLFVIDKQTRSTVSLVESAFMAGDGKKLVVVIYPFDYDVISITDSTKQVSNVIETTNELTKSRLQTLNKSSSIIQSATSSTSSTLVRSSDNTESIEPISSSTSKASSMVTTKLTSTISSTIGKHNCKIDERTVEATNEKAKQASGTIRMNGEIISLGEFKELKQARFILQNLVARQRIPMFSDILQALKHISCRLSDNLEQDERPCFMNKTDSPLDHSNPLRLELHQQPVLNIQYPNLLDRPPSLSPLQIPITTTAAPNSATIAGQSEYLRDVYLSHDGDDSTNVESMVLPILKEKGLTYNCGPIRNITHPPGDTTSIPALLSETSIDSHMPVSQTDQLNDRYSETLEFDEDSTKLALEKEICAIRSSRVLLFVITNRCRGLSIMILASHFMALFRDNVVLCVQYLEEPCSINGETLTKNAIADYNRGRVYLCDYAIKSQVPVFSTIKEAVDCCSRKCSYNNKN